MPGRPSDSLSQGQDTRRARRLRVLRACELPDPRDFWSLPRRPPHLPRTSSLPPTTRQRSQNPRFRCSIGLPGLLIPTLKRRAKGPTNPAAGLCHASPCYQPSRGWFSQATSSGLPSWPERFSSPAIASSRASLSTACLRPSSMPVSSLWAASLEVAFLRIVFSRTERVSRPHASWISLVSSRASFSSPWAQSSIVALARQHEPTYSVRLNMGVAINKLAIPKTVRNARSPRIAIQPPSFKRMALKP